MIHTRFELTSAEEKYVRSLLDGKAPISEADEQEVAAKLLEMLADSLSGTSRYYVRRLAAQARQAGQRNAQPEHSKEHAE